MNEPVCAQACHESSDGYRYGFQDKENDNELKGTGNNPILYFDKLGDTVKGRGSFNPSDYKKYLATMKKTIEDAISMEEKLQEWGGAEYTPKINMNNAKLKLKAVNQAIKTFNDLDKRKEIIYVGRIMKNMSSDGGATVFKQKKNAPEVMFSNLAFTDISDHNYSASLIAHELLHVQQYFNGKISITIDNTARLLLDIHDEVEANNLDLILGSEIYMGSKDIVKYNKKTLIKKHPTYKRLYKKKISFKIKKYRNVLKADTHVRRLLGIPLTNFYYGWGND